MGYMRYCLKKIISQRGHEWGGTRNRKPCGMWVLLCIASVFEREGEEGGEKRGKGRRRRLEAIGLLEQESQEVSCLT